MVIGIISLFVLGAPLVVGSPLCHMAIGKSPRGTRHLKYTRNGILVSHVASTLILCADQSQAGCTRCVVALWACRGQSSSHCLSEAGGRAAFCEFFGNCSSFGAVNVATPDDDTEYAITAQNSNINITYHIYSGHHFTPVPRINSHQKLSSTHHSQLFTKYNQIINISPIQSGEETNSNTNQVVASTIELIFRKNVVVYHHLPLASLATRLTRSSDGFCRAARVCGFEISGSDLLRCKGTND
eukprot:1366054-Amorphochlora_amoeboformis.AAC.1